MKVLIYGNRKQDDDIYDISTPEKDAATFLKLFNYLRDEWQVYGELEEEPEPLETCEACTKELHRLCESGVCGCVATEECKKKSRNTRTWRDAEADQRTLYNLAKAGDALSAKKLLISRKKYEYEGFRYGEVIDPLWR